MHSEREKRSLLNGLAQTITTKQKLVVVESRLFAQVPLENLDLLLEVFDDILLVAADPTGQTNWSTGNPAKQCRRGPRPKRRPAARTSNVTGCHKFNSPCRTWANTVRWPGPSVAFA